MLGELPDLPVPARAARPRAGRRPDRPHRRAARRPAGGDHAGRLAARRPPRAATSAGRATCCARDLDALEEPPPATTGPLKVQVCGPWTLAATIELTAARDPALADPGAVADLTASLAEGVAAHVAEVRSACPARTCCCSSTSPPLPAVLAGTVPTASGLSRVRRRRGDRRPSQPARGARSAARRFTVVVHCCAAGHPVRA